MRSALSFIAALLLLPAAAPSAAAQGFFASKTKVNLMLDQSTAKPGSTITAGVKLMMPKNWHTYWRNPGQNGKATGVKWTLPTGITAGAVQWPVPHKVVSWEMHSFEFSEEVVLLVPLTIADSVPAGTVSLKADLDWLECETEGACVPGAGKVETKLVIGGESKPSPQADELKQWAGYLPKDAPSIELTAYWDGPAKKDQRGLVLEWKPTSKTNDFFSFRSSDRWVVEPPTKVISQSDDKLVIRQMVTKYEGDWPKKIEGIIVDLEGHPKHPKAVNVAAAIQNSKPRPAGASTDTSPFGSGIFGALGGVDSKPKAVPSLQLDHESAIAGSTVNALLKFTVASHWHIYWRNPGMFADAPKFTFRLPDGITAGESGILWPVPKKAVKRNDDGSEIWNYELADAVGIIIPMRLGSNVAAGEHEIVIDLSWVECETDKLCVPQTKSVSAKLIVGAEAKTSAALEELKTFIQQTPKPADALGVLPTGTWESQVSSNQHSFGITWEGDAKSDFYSYEPNGDWTIGIASEHPDAGAGKISVRKVLTLNDGELPDAIRGIWVTEKDGRKTAYEVTVPITGTSAPGVGDTAAAPQELNFVSAMLLAFLGGFILNIMPCVLPVISLKILGFVNQSNDSPGEVKKLGVIYCLGVLASFLVMALLVIGVQKAGNVASWGMQFGNPVFLVCMLTLVTLVALNLFGVFEVTLGGGAMGAANSLASKHGPTGAFFNGVLATALATPCTAPFLAPALGFAFVQPPPVIIIMFLTVGAGLALPYLILSMNPQWLKFLPRPGNWMISFKHAMGFPMLATAIWLLWTATDRFGQDGVLWLGFFLVLVSLSVWIWGEFVQRGTKRKGLAVAFSLLFLATGVGYALEHKLQWRNPPDQNPTGNAIVWKPWSHEAIAAAQGEGRPVLVDFTAKWCATCNANKTFSIDIDSTRDVLKDLKYETLKADNTLLPEHIVREIHSFSRAGVPLVLVYPPDAGRKPIIMPASFTAGMIQEALKKAAGK